MALMQIWWRGETVNPKLWTDKKQPYFPYIIFENIGLTTNAYYDPKGIDWIKDALIKEKERTKDLSFAEGPFRDRYNKLKPFCERQPVLSRGELSGFLKEIEDAWPRFEAMWWIWEFGLYGKSDSERLLKLRDETQNFVPGAEAIIRKSLKNIYPEIRDLISVISLEEIINSNLPKLEILEERASGYFYTDSQLFINKNKSFIENKYKIKLEELKYNNVKEIKGQIAFKGLAKGIVKIVYGAKQMDKVESGDVIISSMTLPDFLPAINKAAAIVTDEGGITCHAAIVARELKKPCIIGTKIATKVLKGGDLVEVDAERGIVRILEKKK